MAGSQGTAYLLHFERKMSHAQHYIGFANGEGLPARMDAHRKKRGAAITKAFVEQGIGFEIARLWVNVDKNFERNLKNQKNAWRFCPICRKERGYEKCLR